MSSLDACSAARTAKSSTLPAPTTDAQLVRVCPHDKLSTSITNCTSESSLATVQRKCQNKTSCELFASDSVFGDPCSGVYKYLAVGYRRNALDVSVDFNPRRHKGGGVNLTPSIFLVLNFCSLTDYQKLWHNCSLFVKTSFDPN